MLTFGLPEWSFRKKGTVVDLRAKQPSTKNYNMSDKNDSQTFEEMQQQLQKILRQIPPGAAPFGTAGVTPGSAPQAEQGSGETDAKDQEILNRIRQFSLKPKDIRDHLNKFVIKQDEAKKVLSVAICDHYNHVRRCLEDPREKEREYSKQNIVLLGPTGVGKTYLMRNIAKLIGVPFVKADATKFSETGYVGSDVEDLVRDLVKAANGNTDLAQYGIVYVDEIDKIAGATTHGGRDVSGRGVQINLLKLMEETEVNLNSPNDIMGQMQAMMSGMRGGKPREQTISTRHILFIVSGAFDQLAENVRKRVDSATIGFASRNLEGGEDLFRYLSRAATTDFIRYGFEPEFIGRLPVRVACEALQKDDLAQILTSSEGSLLKQYQGDFRGYGIEFKITPEAIGEIASQAYLEKTGARGLMTVFERVFRNFKFELPSTAIKSFEVTTDTIARPMETLKQLIVENKDLMAQVWRDELEAFATAFEREHDIQLKFLDEAAEVLIAAATEEDRTLRTICEARFKDFQHGLTIIRRNTGRTQFTIDRSAAAQPDRELSRWVVESFQNTDKA